MCVNIQEPCVTIFSLRNSYLLFSLFRHYYCRPLHKYNSWKFHKSSSFPAVAVFLQVASGNELRILRRRWWWCWSWWVLEMKKLFSRTYKFQVFYFHLSVFSQLISTWFLPPSNWQLDLDSGREIIFIIIIIVRLSSWPLLPPRWQIN